MIRFAIGSVLCLAMMGCGSAPQSTQTQTTSSPVVLGSSSGAQLNAIRASANLPAVQRNSILDAAAQTHANDMAAKGFFDHKGSDGSTVGKRTTRAGYRWCVVAENIAKGYRSQESAIESWRTSPGHYRNMTLRNVSEFGMARVGDYWVMVLAGKRC